MPLVLLLVGATTGAPATAATRAAPRPATWEQWLHLPGVFDLSGPRRDGRLVAAAHDRLALVSPSGRTHSFAPAYSVPDGSESYLALSPGLTLDKRAATNPVLPPLRCRFDRDLLLALDLRGAPPGITEVAADGKVRRLASVPGVSNLAGITLDTVGSFGHRLLVIGPARPGTTQVTAVDCLGRATPVATVDVPLEGGVAVAPRGFGPYGGQLIAADETGGSIYAISPAGKLSTVTRSGLPAGGDIGVESAGFVPPRPAAAYLADRGTPGNPHPGTDSILRLTGAAMSSAGIRAGDLLVATEGGATVVRVRCGRVCEAAVVVTGPPSAHAEGRLLVVAREPASRTGRPGLLVVGTSILIVIAAAILLLWRQSRAPGRAAHR